MKFGEQFAEHVVNAGMIFNCHRGLLSEYVLIFAQKMGSAVCSAMLACPKNQCGCSNCGMFSCVCSDIQKCRIVLDNWLADYYCLPGALRGDRSSSQFGFFSHVVLCVGVRVRGSAKHVCHEARW